MRCANGSGRWATSRDSPIDERPDEATDGDRTCLPCRSRLHALVLIRRRSRGRRTAKHDNIVVVSGLPRSGTSLMMKMLEAGGLEPLEDGLREPDVDNPRGYYELEQVKKLSAGDVAWLDAAPGKVVKVIATLLYHLPDTYNYRVVFMRRRMAEVLASQRQMLVNRGEDPEAVADADMARIFEGHLQRLEPWLAARDDIQVLDVDYNELLTGRSPEIVDSIAAFLGAGLDSAAMREVVEPDLYRQRR